MPYLNNIIIAKITSGERLSEQEQIDLIHARDSVNAEDYPSKDEYYSARRNYITLLAEYIGHHKFDANVERLTIQDWLEYKGWYSSPYTWYFADYKLWQIASYSLLNHYITKHAFSNEVEVEFVTIFLEQLYGKRKGCSLNELFVAYYHRWHYFSEDAQIAFIQNATAISLHDFVNYYCRTLTDKAEAEFIRQRSRFTENKAYVVDRISKEREYYIPKEVFDRAFKSYLKKRKESGASGLTFLAQEALLDSGYTDLIEFHENLFGRKLYPQYRYEIERDLSLVLRCKKHGWDWQETFNITIRNRLRPKTEQELLKPKYAELLPIYEAKWGPIKEG